MTFSISVSPSRIKRLSISGVLDAETASQPGLRMIDSIGVGMLVTVYKRLRARGVTFALSGLRDQPLAMFKLLGLHRLTAGSDTELC